MNSESAPVLSGNEQLLEALFDGLNIGLLMVDEEGRIIRCNRFIETYSGRSADAMTGENLYQSFPELPQEWVAWKIRNVFLLNNLSYSSWKDRPHLFSFKHDREITGADEHMFQDCAFVPVTDAENKVVAVSIVIIDMTDVGIYQNALKDANDIIVVLKKLSSTDGLTGVNNRLTLEERIEEEFSRAKRHETPLSFFIMDLDKFKLVNDTHGHGAGDDVLKIAAKRISERTRETDIFGRYGGEEFCLIMPGSNRDEAKKVANDFRLALCSEPMECQDVTLTVSASFGVAEYQPTMEGYRELMETADRGLYKAKEAGRNCVQSVQD